MSDSLYFSRLRWSTARGAGLAKLHGRQVDLRQAPQLLGLRIIALDYVPEIGLALLQTFDGPMRDMSHAEIMAADLLLREAVLGTAGTGSFCGSGCGSCGSDPR